MQGADPFFEHSSPSSSILEEQQFSAPRPPPSLEQCLPPHLPHSALQQLFPFWMPGMPLLHTAVGCWRDTIGNGRVRVRSRGVRGWRRLWRAEHDYAEDTRLAAKAAALVSPPGVIWYTVLGPKRLVCSSETFRSRDKGSLLHDIYSHDQPASSRKDVLRPRRLLSTYLVDFSVFVGIFST